MTTATINSNTGILKYGDMLYEVGSYEYYQVITKLSKIRHIGDTKQDNYTLWKYGNWWRAKKRIKNYLRTVYVGLSNSLDNCTLKKVSEAMKLTNLQWYNQKKNDQ